MRAVVAAVTGMPARPQATVLSSAAADLIWADSSALMWCTLLQGAGLCWRVHHIRAVLAAVTGTPARPETAAAQLLVTCMMFREMLGPEDTSRICR